MQTPSFEKPDRKLNLLGLKIRDSIFQNRKLKFSSIKLTYNSTITSKNFIQIENIIRQILTTNNNDKKNKNEIKRKTRKKLKQSRLLRDPITN